MKKQTYRFGLWAEKITILCLVFKGYKILAWRYKNNFGELDIVAKKGKEIVVIEVKARRSENNLEEILRYRQINRMVKAAQFFMSKNRRFQQYQVRFDFVFVNKFFWIKHYKNFFF